MSTLLKITGMSCTHCERAVREALESVDGVDSASIDLTSGTATVSGTADVGTLIAAVVEEGYAAEPAAA